MRTVDSVKFSSGAAESIIVGYASSSKLGGAVIVGIVLDTVPSARVNDTLQSPLRSCRYMTARIH